MLQQMFEVTAKIRSSSLKPMFTWKRRLLPWNAAHAREISGTRTLGAHRTKQVREKRYKIILRRDISKDLLCK